jgi:hypothetical protein
MPSLYPREYVLNSLGDLPKWRSEYRRLIRDRVYYSLKIRRVALGLELTKLERIKILRVLLVRASLNNFGVRNFRAHIKHMQERQTMMKKTSPYIVINKVDMFWMPQ